MNKAKMVLVGLAVFVAAVGGGWLWGSWGRWAAERQLRDAVVRAELSDASAALSAARVNIAELNFGQAGGNVERARKSLESAAAALDAAGRQDAAPAVKDAIAKAAEAQQLTARADQSSSARVADALKAVTLAASVPQK
jgi:hypothetical protein